MTYLDLLEQLKLAPHDELRSDDPVNFEVVVKITDMPKICAVLDSFFGKALKPTGEKPSSQAAKIAEPYGGIYNNQTLYHLQSGAEAYCALIWPWGSGASATVKVIRSA